MLTQWKIDAKQGSCILSHAKVCIMSDDAKKKKKLLKLSVFKGLCNQPSVFSHSLH